MERKKLKQILFVSTCIIAIFFLFWRMDMVAAALGGLLKILTPFILGGALAVVFNVPMRFLERKVFSFMNMKPVLKKLKRPLALLIVIVLVLSVAVLLISLVIPQLEATIVSIINAVPGFIERANAFAAQYDINLSKYLKLPTGEDIGMEVGKALDLLLKGVAFSGSIIGTIYDRILNFFFTIMFMVYFLFAKERLANQVKRAMQAYLKPKLGGRLMEIGRLTHETFDAFLTGQCLEALILGGLFFICMSIFRMPYVLLISLFIAVMALIPVIGAWAGCIVGALLILLVDPTMALWFVIMFLILQQIEGNLIYPHVMGSAVGLPSLWVLFAVVLGEGLFGVLGMLVFIPLTSVGYSLVRDSVNRRLALLEDKNTPADE